MIRWNIALTLFMLVSTVHVTFAEQRVGIFFDEAKNCQIKRGSSQFKCFRGAELHDKDVLFAAQPVEKLPLTILPGDILRFETTADGGSKAVYLRPKDNMGLFSRAMYMLGLDKKRATIPFSAVTRGDDELTCRPGGVAALLPGVPVIFGTGDVLVVKEKAEKISVFRQKVGKIINITSEELGLQSGKQYSWLLEGSSCNGEVSLLETENVKQVLEALAKVDSDKGLSPGEKALRKSSYLMLFGPSFDKGAVMDWLSQQILDESSAVMTVEESNVANSMQIGHRANAKSVR